MTPCLYQKIGTKQRICYLSIIPIMGSHVYEIIVEKNMRLYIIHLSTSFERIDKIVDFESLMLVSS